MTTRSEPGRPWPRAALIASFAVGLGLAGCAQMAEPPGGPPDLLPPRIVSAIPESLATGVDSLAPIRITFSEKVDRTAVREWFFVSPYRPIAHVDWKAGTASFRFQGGLPADTTIVIAVGTGVRDRAGNSLPSVFRRSFSTGARLASGLISGRVLRSHRAAAPAAPPTGAGRTSPGSGSTGAANRNEPAMLLWLYRVTADTLPDPLKENPDLATEVDRDGRFLIEGLPVDRPYRLLALLDADRSRGPGGPRDLRAWHPEVVTLPPDKPRREDLEIFLIDPKSPGSISGDVAALADSSAADTLKSAVLAMERAADVDSLAMPWPPTTGVKEASLDKSGRFVIRSLRPGRYRLAAFLDADGNGRWSVGDPIGEWREVDVRPDEESAGPTLPRPPRPAGGARP